MSTITIDWLHIVALLGALQGVLLAGALAAYRANRTANRLLAALVFACTIHLVASVYYASGLVERFPQFFGVSYGLPWLYGPLAYLYAAAASDGSRRWTRRDALHLLPFALVLLATFQFYLLSGPEKVALLERIRGGDAPRVLQILDPTKFVSGIAYTIATAMLLVRHRRRVKESYSTVERVNLNWLLLLLGAAAVIWFVATASDLVLAQGSIRSGDDVVALAIAVFVYAIGYMGFRQPEVFRFELVKHKTSEFPVPKGPAVVETVEPPAAAPTTVRYERSGLGAEEAVELKQSLLAVMTADRPYRDPDLTLANLAERLDTTPHKLSEVLNSELSQTFYDFVNGYRIDEVRQRLGEDQSKHLTVLALAMDAGFASKSTFNQVFKKHTGQTPSKYRSALAG
jgi:AraC-like DNA-binding protein